MLRQLARMSGRRQSTAILFLPRGSFDTLLHGKFPVLSIVPSLTAGARPKLQIHGKNGSH